MTSTKPRDPPTPYAKCPLCGCLVAPDYKGEYWCSPCPGNKVTVITQDSRKESK